MARNNNSSGIRGPGALPPKPEEIYLARKAGKTDWKRIFYISLGVAVFCIIYYSPHWSQAVDPKGASFALTPEGKAALAIFALGVIWWTFEVVPLGVTSVAIVVMQGILLVGRELNSELNSGDAILISQRIKYGVPGIPRIPISVDEAFRDFFDPAIWFVFASLIIGLVFNKTGLSKRIMYKMLTVMGERTSTIYLGCFTLVGILTLVMAHTAVAATVFPLFMAIYSLYEGSEKPTKFGKGLFMGMAFSAGAGSVVTLLGSARAPVAIGLFRRFTIDAAHPQGVSIGFLDLPMFMLPLGWLMIIMIWAYIMIVFRPEKKAITGLRERANMLYERLGPLTQRELLSLVIVGITVVILCVGPYVNLLRDINMSAVILGSSVLFFLFNILTAQDLEELPWNIILLFGGAMSIGLCLHDTGAAQWLAVKYLGLFHFSGWSVFVLSAALIVLICSNFVLNMAVIAIALPVALVMADYVGAPKETVLFAILAVAGMPFMLLIGAAPNAIAYGSGQFTDGQFLRTGIPLSIILMGLLALFIKVVWPFIDQAARL